jgi:hypothetical protein
LKGGFLGKQRHDDSAEEPNGVALQRLLKSVAKGFHCGFIAKHVVERVEREHATGPRSFGAACGVS